MPRTPGIRRTISNTLTVVSLLLMLATVVLWVRSYSFGPRTFFEGTASDFDWVVHSGNGAVTYRRDIGKVTYRRYNDELSFLGFAWERKTSNPWGFYWVRRWHWSISVPYWFFTFIFAFVPIIWFIGWLKCRRLAMVRKCPACGYDLTGNESGVCPECGVGAERPDFNG